MPIEPPTPTGKLLEGTRALLAELRAAALNAPHDTRIVIAVEHVNAALLALEHPSHSGVPRT